MGLNLFTGIRLVVYHGICPDRAVMDRVLAPIDVGDTAAL